MKTEHKVWIELPRPKSLNDAKIICEKANRMMSRLCPREEGDSKYEFFVYEKEGKFVCYCFGGAMGFAQLADRGDWFNLDYLGRE